jgi:Protein of unknown function (DUF1822)
MISFDNATQLWLEISAASIEQSWQQSQLCSTSEGRWHTYLNQICLQTLLPWLQETYELNHTSHLHPVEAIWEVVNGTAIEIGQQRLVLIPSHSLDTSEFYLPQEWIDLPSWIADYYLAVQINLDETWLRIWGYTTHRELKANSSYDVSDRTYCLEAEALNQDLTLLWIDGQLAPREPTRQAITPLPILPIAQSENLLQRLSQRDLAMLRLELPFELWGALLEQPGSLQRLYQLRSGVNLPNKAIINLSQWWQDRFEESWQSLENLFGSEMANLAVNLRDSSSGGVKRVKIVNLETTRQSQPLGLLLVLEAEPDSRIAIRVRLCPTENNLCLPSHLRLALISSSGAVLQSVEARSEDDFIQLKRFKCPPQMRFSIEVSLEDFSFTEDFTT